MKTIQSYSIIAAVLFLAVFGFSSCEKTDIEVISPACTLETYQNHPYADRYQNLINYFSDKKIPGVELTVITPEGTWTGTGGYADIENGIKVSPCHTMHIGSTSKIFGSVITMMMQEEGLLDIDDKINEYIPHDITDKIPNGNKATLRQCLNHTSGIPEHVAIEQLTEIMNLTIADLSAEESLKYIYGKKALWEPGGGKQYSNSNYLLVALAVKYAAGANSFYDILKDKLLKPYGLDNTYVGTEIPDNMTLGYYNQYGAITEWTFADNNAVGGEDRIDGGLISNTADLAKFMQMLISGEILSAESLAEMKEFEDVEIDGFEHITGYGLGFMKTETDKAWAFGHYGTVLCFSSGLFYFPEEETVMAFTVNGDPGDGVSVTYGKDALDYLFED